MNFICIFFWEVNTSSENHHDFLFIFFWKKVVCSSSSRWKIFCIKDWCRKKLHNNNKKMFFSAKILIIVSLFYLVGSRGRKTCNFFPSKKILLQPEDFFFKICFCLILWPFFYSIKMDTEWLLFCIINFDGFRKSIY